MKYRNTKTGAVIDSPCTITGGPWEAVEPDTSSASKASGLAKTSGQPPAPDTSAAAQTPPQKTTRKKAAK